jgi:oligopeptide/dipeptide ABC transporter ATP-binding protein
MADEALLTVKDLVVEFQTRRGIARVLNRISLRLEAGEILGLVGESGCGKSMSSLAIMGLVPTPPGRISAGEIVFKGTDLTKAGAQRLRQIRGSEISMIFQEPMTSLNPVFTVGEQIAETVRLHDGASKEQARRRAVEMLKAVQIPAAETRIDAYPHELSGGMRQRVMIAMALACRPAVLIADEPTTALDVTVQAQIFDLLRGIREETGCAIILITHDMGAIAEMADRVAVMYAGHIVEEGPVEAILDDPQHPYTERLIACVPHVLSDLPEVLEPLEEISGVVPSLFEIGRGCPFAARCHRAFAPCTEDMPRPTRVSPGHAAACFVHGSAAGPGEATA